MASEAPARRRPPTEVNFLRYVERDSPVHRLWAGTKLLALGAVGTAVSIRSGWASEGVAAAVLAGAWLLSRVPVGAVPRAPWWFWAGVAVTAVTAGLAGGRPTVHLGSVSVGLGGIDQWARLTVLVAILLGFTALMGWTTRLGDLAPAAATLAAPARWVKVPVDELAVVVALGVRCLPVLVDEMRTLSAARRVRRPPTPETVRQLLRDVVDLVSTVLVATARRAEEMADAITARGGVGTVSRSRPRLRAAEVVAWTVTAAAVAGVALI